MTNPKGYRRGTRDMFSRAHKKRGVEHLSTYLKNYKIGDIVDVKGKKTMSFFLELKKFVIVVVVLYNKFPIRICICYPGCGSGSSYLLL
jgi:ribosomal protein L21E